jgi:hypothetical protein
MIAVSSDTIIMTRKSMLMENWKFPGSAIEKPCSIIGPITSLMVFKRTIRGLHNNLIMDIPCNAVEPDKRVEEITEQISIHDLDTNMRTTRP